MLYMIVYFVLPGGYGETNRRNICRDGDDGDDVDDVITMR